MKTESLLYILFNTDTVRNYFGESVDTQTDGRPDGEEAGSGEALLRRDAASESSGGVGDLGGGGAALVDGSEDGGTIEPEGAF